MTKLLRSDWQLTNTPLAREDFIRSFQDFEYFTSHCQQIVDKRRRLVYMRLNVFQKYVFGQLLPLLNPETRLDKRRDIVWVKPRQCGMTTGMIAFINWFLSCVESIENFNFIHILPAVDTISKLYTQKVAPIVQGVHPDIMATIEKMPAMTSSIRLYYKDIMGVRRNNYYDLVSANASSLRSGTANAILYDEVSFYRHPEELEDAVSPMLPPYGFSLVIYASTFDDKQSEFFKNKIITARENPDTWTLMFSPWFQVYPEEPQDVPLDSLELTEYDTSVIMPAMAEYGLPKDLWGDAISWYHETSTRTSNMRKEYPTTLDEVLAIGENKSVFTAESLAKQEKNIIPGHLYRLKTDTLTGKTELQKADESEITLYQAPMLGHRYRLVCDPIGSSSEDSDFYAASMWDLENNGQVAKIYTRGLPVEDLADLTAGLATVYNRAQICPEKNMGQALVACIRAKGYYNLYYASDIDRKRKDPGIRTSVSSKPDMLDKTQLLLDGERIIIRDEETLRQLKEYSKIIRKSGAISFSAPKGDHDDLASTVFLYAGSLDQRALGGKTTQGFAIL